MGFSTAERVDMLKRPWKLPLFALRLVSCWARLAVRSTSARLRRRPDVVVVGYLGHFDVLLARLLFPRTTIVLDHLIFAGTTASDRGVSGGLKGRLLAGLDRLAIAAASIVVVDTEEHARLVPASASTVVVPVGADSSWYAAAAGERVPGARLSVVFYGLMTPLQGAPVIAEAIATLDGRVDATIIGTGQDGEAVDATLRAVDGVTRLDWVGPSELPALVARHDLALGIFGTSEKALSVVPNKAYQALAAEVGLITSDSAAQRRVLGDAAEFVPPGDASALAAAIDRLAGDPTLIADLRARARAAAPRFTAAAVVGGLVERLAERP
ncbi:glycosyltransferase [Labedella gwakjiensis]|nr:glycosyltransferase [Labedella gwakjiensis]